jgi:hypothetical protein
MIDTTSTSAEPLEFRLASRLSEGSHDGSERRAPNLSPSIAQD